MNAKRIFILLAIAALAVALPARSEKVASSGAEVGKWTQDFSAATALAAEKSLPILLNFTGSDWCYWCKLMERRVVTKQEWKDWAKDKIVLVFINFPQDKKLVPKRFVERNNSLQEKFGVEGYPTFVVLASDGATVLGELGASRDASPAQFIAKIEELLKAPAKEAPGK